MIKTFAFLITVWPVETPVPMVHVPATGLSGEECLEKIVEWYEDGYGSIGTASCEADLGFEEGSEL